MRPAFAFARDRHIHRAVDALLHAGDQGTIIAQGAPPFGHARDKDAFIGACGRIGDPVVKLIERFTRPKGRVESARIGACAAKHLELCEGDRPNPDRSHDQGYHDKLDRDACTEKQRNNGIIRLLRDSECFGFHSD